MVTQRLCHSLKSWSVIPSVKLSFTRRNILHAYGEPTLYQILEMLTRTETVLLSNMWKSGREASHCSTCGKRSGCSVTKWCLNLCHPMNYKMPGFSVLHYLTELAQTHVHWVGDAIQPSHPLSSPSPPAFNLSQHQGLIMSQLFTSGGQNIRASTSFIPMNIQGWFPLLLISLISLLFKGLSRVFAALKAPILWCSAFFMVQLSHPFMTTGKTIALAV